MVCYDYTINNIIIGLLLGTKYDFLFRLLEMKGLELMDKGMGHPWGKLAEKFR